MLSVLVLSTGFPNLHDKLCWLSSAWRVVRIDDVLLSARLTEGSVPLVLEAIASYRSAARKQSGRKAT